MVVIGIIALLIAMLLPTLGRTREQARSVKCLTQMRQLSQAFVMYSNDNRGAMPSCDTCGPIYPQTFTDTNGSVTPNWVGWVDGGPLPQAIQNGTLWPFIKSLDAYHCPSDTNDYRVRSYSMNTMLDTGSATSPLVNDYKIYRINQIRDTGRCIVFAEEPDPRGTIAGGSSAALASQWNVNGWNQYPMDADSWDGKAGWWVDVVASWHHGGSNFSFADGHAEYRRFSDSRTVNFLKNDPTWPTPDYYTPHNVDLDWIRSSIVTWPRQR
jgi:prepilin-type processing-associated H-X9-DG protein